MRKITLMLGAALLALAVVACEGPLGPLGPEGPQGPAGAPGHDALNTCTSCHNNSIELKAIERQFENSTHWTTLTFERDGNTCNFCHTHQGFMTVAVEGKTAPTSVPNSAPINCRTCHKVHTTYTESDYALTTTNPVKLLWGGGTADLHPKGNLCVNCHQARVASPMPVLNGPNITISASAAPRYGPHYGTQGNVAAAQSLFRFQGSKAIPTTPTSHGLIGCAECHMTPAIGQQVGGHVFKLSYTQAGYGTTTQLIRACTKCHSTAVTFDWMGIQTRTKNQMNELKALLQAEGIMGADGYARAGSWNANVAAAFLNYRTLYYDRSSGLHHPEFVDAILTNTIEAMKARK
jgi:hypothetical protein